MPWLMDERATCVSAREIIAPHNHVILCFRVVVYQDNVIDNDLNEKELWDYNDNDNDPPPLK